MHLVIICLAMAANITPLVLSPDDFLMHSMACCLSYLKWRIPLITISWHIFAEDPALSAGFKCIRSSGELLAIGVGLARMKFCRHPQ